MLKQIYIHMYTKKVFYTFVLDLFSHSKHIIIFSNFPPKGFIGMSVISSVSVEMSFSSKFNPSFSFEDFFDSSSIWLNKILKKSSYQWSDSCNKYISHSKKKYINIYSTCFKNSWQSCCRPLFSQLGRV